MKKAPAVVSGILFVVLLFYFSGFESIYPSKLLLAANKNSVNKSSAFPENGNYHKVRDLKLSDYTESENFILPGEKTELIDGLEKVQFVPWEGPLLVVIDPGHGGAESGAAENGLVEKDITLDVSLRLNRLLQESGIDTYMTRDSDTTVDLKERIFTANAKNAALFISIHSNWFYDYSYSGVMTLYYPSNSLSAGYLSELEYAITLQNELSKALNIKDRGIIDRPNLAVLRHAKMPTALVELGFMTNRSDCELLSSGDFRQKAAEALAEGIKKSLSKIK